ncbi:MAG: porin family protein [Hyphomicrobiales bacterium]|nr:porin family protein [Hyphomicrobiales bacterium]
MTKTVLVALGSFALFAGPAFAADLPMLAPSAPMAVTSSYDWTGPYVGAVVGYGQGTVSIATPPSFILSRSDTFDVSGLMGGLTAGYNYQVDSFVLGIEGDISWSGERGTGHPLDASATPAVPSESLDWLGTLRARAGVAADRFLIYGTAGVAFGGLSGSVTNVTTPGDTRNVSGTQAGWTAGIGAEYALADNITIKAEYLYVDLGTKSYVATGPILDFPFDNHFATHIVRAGLNFKF